MSVWTIALGVFIGKLFYTAAQNILDKIGDR